MKLLGLNIKRELKESRAASTILRLLLGRSAVFTPKDYAALSKAGYQNCMAVYACVRLVARSVAGIPWGLYKLNREGDLEEVDDHDLLRLFRRPNPREGQARFHEKVIAYLLLSGNSYIERAGPDKGAPRELYALRPDRMEVVPGTPAEPVAGYVYKVGGGKTDFKASEILHLKMFHPLDDWYGMSPLEVGAAGVDISNAAQTWNLKLLQNDMRPPGAFTVKSRLTEEERTLLRKDVKEHYMGAENAAVPLLLEGDFDWKQFMVTPRDMDWLKSDLANSVKICSVFGVPPELIGNAEQKTYSNYQEARIALYQETVLPLADWYRDELNNWLAPLFGEGLLLDYNRDEIEALKEDAEKTYTYLQGADWLTVDEKRAATGYEALGPEAGGDLILVPMGKVSLADVGLAPTTEPETETGSEPEPEPKPEDEEPKSRKSVVKSFWVTPERKEALWNNFVSRVKAKERGFLGDTRAYLNRQGEVLKARIEKYDRPGSIRIGNIFDIHAETKAFVKAFYPRYEWLFKHAGEAGLRATKGELYSFDETKEGEGDFDMTEALRTSLKKMVIAAGRVINEATLKSLVDMIETADFEEITVKELAQRIYDTGLFGPDRAIRIARTETGKVENGGMVEGYRQNEYVEKKGWLCAFVEDSREAHKAADGQEVALDADFSVGGESLAYPGDPKGQPGNIVNCLCATYPVVNE